MYLILRTYYLATTSDGSGLLSATRPTACDIISTDELLPRNKGHEGTPF